MLAFMVPPLKERFARLTYRQKDLADAAGVDPKTVSLLVLEKRERPNAHVSRAIEQALAAHEIALRDYLVAIHGLPQGEGE